MTTVHASITVLTSALGPVLLASVYQRTGSYGSIFYLLARAVGVLAALCWRTTITAFSRPVNEATS